MTHAITEMRNDVVRVLQAHQVSDYAFGKDGSGHQVVTFDYSDRRLAFHFPSTGRMNGRSRLNVVARLKRELREVAPTAPKIGIATVTPTSLIQPAAEAVAEKVGGPVDRHTAIYQAVAGGEPLDIVRERFGLTKDAVWKIFLAVKARVEGASCKVTAPLTSLLKPRRPKIKKPPARHAARNREIYAAVRRGEKYAAIGRRFGNLCGPRIKQIAIEMDTYFKSLPPQAEEMSLTF